MIVFIVFVLIVYVVQGVFWGKTVQKIIENKGYYNNWFWWGFFGAAAAAKASAKPVLEKNIYNEDTFLERLYKDGMPDGGRWKCPFCNSVNEEVIFTCVCGKSREDGRKYLKVQDEKHEEQKIITLLKEYKELMDNGIITQEEFDAKKRNCLSKGIESISKIKVKYMPVCVFLINFVKKSQILYRICEKNLPFFQI